MNHDGLQINQPGLNYMSGAFNAKKLLSHYNKKQYRLFTLNDDEQLSLTVTSSVPGVGASQRKDFYKKTISHPDSPQHVKFITKNDEPHAFIWQTKPEQLKNAVRWGIIKTHSITSKVIGTLGNYRITAHERIAKGVLSNSQIVKLKLLDLYQDRFEALQDIESMVNKDNTPADYELTLKSYIANLEKIKANLSVYFADVMGESGLDLDTIEHIKKDLEADIERTKSYLSLIKTDGSTNSFNTARGTHSIMEFVKQQMVHGLYELQGINQDLSFSTKRTFAFSRGELNDFIEDARKEIDEQQADIHNAVTQKHHGNFAEKEELVSYDFSTDELSSKRERDVLLAISFIEGWDKVDTKKLTVSNQYGEESLDVIAATKWKTHRNFITFAKGIGYYLVNLLKSTILPTKPWEEESWSDKNFHLVAKELREHSTPNEPMWKKPVKLIKQIGYAIADLYNGVRDFGTELTVKMPEHIINDWNSCNELIPFNETLQNAEEQIIEIKQIETRRLDEILRRCNITPAAQNITESQSKLAHVEYALTAGEQNDILTVMVRGLTEFTTIFSHDFAKDPVKGLIFTSAFAAGAGAIYLPGAAATVFGSAYVNWFTKFSFTMGSSKFAAVVAGGSTQAQVLGMGWDSMMHGPSGLATDALYRLGEDPLTIAAYVATATGVGYVLVNGIAGYPIPVLSDFLKEDLGSSPESSYPFIGAKVAILLYEALLTHKEEHFPQPEILPELMDKARALKPADPEQQKIIDRFILATWISLNAEHIPKLNDKLKFELARQISALFDKAQSKSLNKLLYPETHHSIAYQALGIPLSYIPAVLRLLTSFVLSTVALISGKSHPAEPIKRASMNLFDKLARDLSRLLVFTTHLIYLLYTGLSMLVKPLTYTLTMLMSRITALFDVKFGHASHVVFASIHNFLRSIGEFFYPTQVIKSVTTAHPTHTIKETGSYTKLLSQMSDNQSSASESDVILTNPEHVHLSFTTTTIKKAEVPVVKNEDSTLVI